MRTVFKEKFLKQIEKLHDSNLKSSVTTAILNVEQAQTLNSITNLKKLKGYKSYYRIRIGDYRIGLEIKNETVTFAAFADRKDIYKKFF